MAEIFRPIDGKVDVVGSLPREFRMSSALADKVLQAAYGQFRVDRMSWRPKMDDAVIYLLLNDQREIFGDMVAGLSVHRPKGGVGHIRLGFTREPATTELMSQWTESPPIRLKRAWPDPVQDHMGEDASIAIEVLRKYHDLLISLADVGALKRGSTSKPEQRLKRLLQRMFPEADFAKARPTWLVGDKGKTLELDIYSESLKLAVEVQGPYHYLPIQGNDLLERQQRRDTIKREKCLEHDVALLLVDAAALNVELLTLAREDQEALVQRLFSQAREHGAFAWPNSTD